MSRPIRCEDYKDNDCKGCPMLVDGKCVFWDIFNDESEDEDI